MPIYEYRCESCEHELEMLRKISDPPLTTCPHCRAETLVKKVSAAAFRLKGGGWYETDFKTDNKKNLAGDAARPETKSEPKSEATPKSDKPAASTGKPDGAAA